MTTLAEPPTTTAVPRVLKLKEAAAESQLSERELRLMAKTGTVRSLPRKPRAAFRFLADHLAEDLASLSRRGRIR